MELEALARGDATEVQPRERQPIASGYRRMPLGAMDRGPQAARSPARSNCRRLGHVERYAQRQSGRRSGRNATAPFRRKRQRASRRPRRRRAVPIVAPAWRSPLRQRAMRRQAAANDTTDTTSQGKPNSRYVDTGCRDSRTGSAAAPTQSEPPRSRAGPERWPPPHAWTNYPRSEPRLRRGHSDTLAVSRHESSSAPVGPLPLGDS